MSRLNLFLVVIFFASFCFAQPTMQVEELDTKNQIRLTYGSTQITLADEIFGFGVNGIKHLGFNSEFCRFTSQAVAAYLWEISFTNDSGAGGNFVNLTNTSDCIRSYTFDPVLGLSLTFSNLDLPGQPDSIDVNVTISPLPQENMTAWRLNIINRSTAYAVWNAKFPKIAFGDIDGDSNNSVLATSASDHGVYASKLTQSIEGLLSNLDYPGTSHMQYMAYYKATKGPQYYPSATRGPGLYLAAHDEHPVAPKKWSITCDAANVRWIFACTNYPEDIQTSKNYTMPYNHIIGTYQGEWFDAAEIYRDWAINQYWTRKGTLYERTDIPQWFKDATYCHRVNTNTISMYDTRMMASNLNSRLAGPMIIQWYHWNEPANSDNYEFPASSNGQPGFGDTVALLKSAKMYSTPYVNIYGWDTTRPDFQSAQQYACKNPDGSFAMTSGVAMMDVGTSFWRNHLSNVVREIVTKYNVPGIYLDQAGAIRTANYDRSHGNPIGFCESQVQFERQNLSEIISAAHSVNPNVMFWGEANSEFAMDLLHGKLIHHNIRRGYYPAFSAVYHDYTTGYGRTQILTFADGDDYEPLMQAAWIWITGYQVGRIWQTTAYGQPAYQEMISYINTLNTLRKSASKYLVLGKMMRPPVIDPCSIPMINGLAEEVPITMPGILVSAWQAPDGKIGLAATNITRQSQTFSMTLGLDEYLAVEAEAYHLYDFLEPSNIISSSASRSFDVSVTLNSLESKVFELSGTSCSSFTAADFNHDCNVDFIDFAELAGSWLNCSDPAGQHCIDARQ